MIHEGEVLEIIEGGYIDNRFGRPQLVISVKHNGAERKLRLSSQNLRRIAAEYGSETSKWVGKKLKVVAIRWYRGLGVEGLILKPVTQNNRVFEEILHETEQASWKPSKFSKGDIASAR